MTLRRLVVVYEKGAATVPEISRSLSQRASLIFVTQEDSGHSSPLLPLLRDMGEVVSFQEASTEVVGRLRSLRPDGIVTYSESMLSATAELAERLGLAYHSQETVELLTDKYRQRQRLRTAGVDSVANCMLTTSKEWQDACRTVGLPAIVKPVQGEGSRNTYRVDDPDEGDRLIARLLRAEPALLVEEFLQGSSTYPYGDYVSVESITIHGLVSHLAITSKFPLLPPFRESGQFWPTHLPDSEQQRVQELAGDAIRALGITSGITHTEIKLTNRGPRLIEVNGRLGGNINELSTRAVGLDLVELAGSLALGGTVDVHSVTPDRMYFQYSNPAPLEPCRLEKVSGPARLRAMPGITGYRAWIRPGMAIHGGVSTHDLDLICGEAADHNGMMELLERALRCLTFTFALPSGRTEDSTPNFASTHLTG
ncbi:ATP-grasp domain-containing protein [Salinispora arenicola]|uniref:ATP-grasp domain-containing protein n=1 Tax=Salinispora arenicola TaxID=168697 RepID=UPI0027DDBFD7|nr:ATP-grasp domain-containing protein [Salinispora arenicola]